MKSTVRKILAILAVASVIFTCACGAKNQPSETPETDAPNQTPVVAELTDELKKEYLSIIRDYEERYGVYTEESEIRDDIPGGIESYRGVYLCELFDWNTDGVPELMVGYTKTYNSSYNFEYLAVYGIENGEVRQLVAQRFNHEHLSLDGTQSFKLAKGTDGLVRLVLANDEAEEWYNSGVDYVSYSDGEISRVALNAYGFDPDRETTAEDDYFERYTIDGRNVSFEEFDAKEKEFGEIFNIMVYEHVDYAALVSFLSGETENYTNEFFSSSDSDFEKRPDWINETDFGYKTTF